VYLRFLQNVRSMGAASLIQFSVQDFNYHSTKKIAPPPHIARGVYDAYFEEFAAVIKEFNHPVFIIINPEMNATWYPYSEANPDTDYTAADYVAMWKHIVDIFRRQGVENVAWIWSPNVLDVG